MTLLMLLLLLPPQQFTWYELYERGEKHYQKAAYSACIDDMHAALAVKQQPKLNQFTRAVQKIDYKPYYYLALAHFELDQVQQAYDYAQKAYAGEVVRSSHLLQSDLGKILERWRLEVTRLHNQFTSEQNIINARTEMMALLSADKLDEVAARLEGQPGTEVYQDIRMQLAMRRELKARTDTLYQDLVSHLEALLEAGRLPLANELFDEVKAQLPPDQQTALAEKLAAAPAPKKDPSTTQIVANDAPLVDQMGPTDQEEIEHFKNKLGNLETQTVGLRAELAAMTRSNRDLQNKLADRKESVVESRTQPVLLLQHVGGRKLQVEAHALTPLRLTSWQLFLNDTPIDTPPIVVPEDNDYHLVHRFAVPDYGRFEIRFSVNDELNGEASVSKTIAVAQPWFLAPALWTALALVLLTAAVLWLYSLWLRKRRARLRHFNPYIAGSPVRVDGMFYGRDALLHRIQGLVHKNSFMIHGARRIGKTSLLLQLKKYLASLDSEEYKFFPAFIDLQGVREEDLFHHMMDELLSHTEDWALTEGEWAILEGGKYQARQFSKDLKRLIAALAQQHPAHHVQVVLLMDEVDVLNEFGEKTNQKLRGIFMKDYAEHLSCVMAGIHLKHEWDSAGSPWYNFFEQIPVGQFAEKDARRLILDPVKGIFSYERAAVALIVDHTDCHPYLIQKVCVSLIGEKLKAASFRITRTDAQTALARLDEEIQRNRNELHHQPLG